MNWRNKMIQKDKILHCGISGALTLIFQIGIMYGTRLNVNAIIAVLASAVIVFAMGWFNEKRDSYFSWADIRANVYGIATVVLATLLISVAFGQDTTWVDGEPINIHYGGNSQMETTTGSECGGVGTMATNELRPPQQITDAMESLTKSMLEEEADSGMVKRGVTSGSVNILCGDPDKAAEERAIIETPEWDLDKWLKWARPQEITFGMWYDYVIECSKDTIKATKYIEGDIVEFMFKGRFENIKEMASEKQLNDRGYQYRYRWLKTPIPTGLYSSGHWELHFEYIFTREPDMKGFVNWIIEQAQARDW